MKDLISLFISVFDGSYSSLGVFALLFLPHLLASVFYTKLAHSKLVQITGSQNH